MKFTFKADTNFFVYTSVFSSEYQKMSEEISALISSRDDWQQDEKSHVEVIDGKEFWVVTRIHPDLEFFKKVMTIIAHNHSDSMLEYLSQNSIVRYLSLDDDDGNVIIPQTCIPLINGQDYIRWIDSLLVSH